jgi:CheY-like chemotaxis protein/HD-like signal output (HDOD) protein
MAKILVVDDVRVFRDPIAAGLRLAGFETVCASNGQEALAAVRAHRPAVVLLDVAMPAMDGVACLRAIRADREIAGTPVIMVTGRADRDLVLEARKLGVQDYLLKANFSLKELLARVAKYTAAPAAPSAAGHRPTGAVAPALSLLSPAPGENASPPPAAERQGPPVVRLLTREQCIARAEKALGAKTLSGAVAEVVALAASPRGNVSDLAPLVARDPILSARVLQVANSAAYSSARPVVSTILDAVRQIGTTTVRSIAAGVGIFGAMPPSAPDGFNPIRCWQHSFAVAMLCERLTGAAANSDVPDPGLMYLVGLCHDLGDILFHTHFGAEYAHVTELQGHTDRPLEELEREVLGMTRGELVQVIVQRFGLPEAVKGPIIAWHDPGAGPASATASSAAVRVLRVAELYANGLLLASSGRSTVAPLSRAECKAALGVDKPSQPDSAAFRSEVFCTTGVLARLSRAEVEALMKPPFDRTRVRVTVVRDPTLSQFDPLTAALDSMAEVRVVEGLTAVDPAACDAIVVLASNDSAPGLTVADLRRAVAARPVMWRVGGINQTAHGDAQPAPRRWPVTLDELYAFVQRSAAGRDGTGPSVA